MEKIKAFMLMVLVAGAVFWIDSSPGHAQLAGAELALLNSEGVQVGRITDGDLVRLQIRLPEETGAAQEISFQLPGSAGFSLTCLVPAAEDRCETDDFRAMGWYWDDSGAPQPSRSITAAAGTPGALVSAAITVAPRPVVLVHGFSSSWEAWTRYLGADGFLASAGLVGFAVGDGQHPGVMNTGLIADPGRKTNTIAENAAILAEYIDAVRVETGAQVVDLVAHSMGGLISRYYIDRLMPGRVVAQLIMLGSPMAGTDCANLPAELRLYLPATLEIQPAYVVGIFNPQITRRHGIPFHALAGVPIISPVQSPCTGTPTDLIVSQASVAAIPLDFMTLPFLHTDLNTSVDVFHDFVQPLLQTPAGTFKEAPDPENEAAAPEPLQFTRIYTGHIDPGASSDVTIVVEPGLRVANFALYDSTRSLAISVTGASGNVLSLDPVANGLITLEDPSTMFYLGYGFENPNPGPWKIELSATGNTPPAGADYALQARFQGGAGLLVSASSLLPRADEPVALSARLELPGERIPIDAARAEIRSSEGESVHVDLEIANGIAEGTWAPNSPGLHSITIIAAGMLPDGSRVERAAHVLVEVQVETTPLRAYATVAGVVLGLSLAGWAVGVVLRMTVRRLRRRTGPAAGG